MDILDALRDGGRVVGVVSHVAEMRDRIPTRLQIDKSRSGSTARLVRSERATRRRRVSPTRRKLPGGAKRRRAACDASAHAGRARRSYADRNHKRVGLKPQPRHEPTATQAGLKKLSKILLHNPRFSLDSGAGMSVRVWLDLHMIETT